MTHLPPIMAHIWPAEGITTIKTMVASSPTGLETVPPNIGTPTMLLAEVLTPQERCPWAPLVKCFGLRVAPCLPLVCVM